MPQPPEQEDKPLTWPYWPLKLRTSSSHEEGAERDFAVATKSLQGKDGKRSLVVAGIKRCDEKYRNESGTMYRSFSAFCRATLARDTAAKFAKVPRK